MTTLTPRELSPRQREILALVAAGRTSKEIARTLGISESTVNWHLSNVFDRLGASSRAEAVAVAMREDARGNAPDTDAQVETPKRHGRPALPLSSIALAIGVTLALGLLGGALMAGWDFTAPTPPSSSVAPALVPHRRASPRFGPAVPVHSIRKGTPRRLNGRRWSRHLRRACPRRQLRCHSGRLRSQRWCRRSRFLPTHPTVAPLPTLPPAPSVPLGLP